MDLSHLSPQRQQVVLAAAKNAEVMLAGMLPPRVSRPGETRPVHDDSFSILRLAANLEDMVAFVVGPDCEHFVHAQGDRIVEALSLAVADSVRNTVREVERRTGARFRPR